MFGFILFLVVTLPIAWLIAEFRGSRTVRTTLGLCAIATSFGVASLAGSLESFQANSYYTSATKQLIDATLAELEDGNTEEVISALQTLQDEFVVTYEYRGGYAEKVEGYVRAIADRDE